MHPRRVEAENNQKVGYVLYKNMENENHGTIDTRLAMRKEKEEKL
jgi:hypothetical protein